MPFTHVSDSLRLYYEKEGMGNPILFIHPPAMGHVTFHKQKRLSKYFQVLTYDMRGHGQSGNNNEPISIYTLAKDIELLLSKLNIHNIVVCGYSNGGSIALEYALRFPKRVKGLILCGGFSEVNSFLLRKEFQLGIMVSKYKGIPLLAKVLAKSHSKNKQFQKEIETYVRQTDATTLQKMYEEGLKYRCTDELTKIHVPTLLVYGSRDYYIHQYQKAFIEKMKNIKIIYISNISHQIPTKKYHEFNQVIKNFMRNLQK